MSTKEFLFSPESNPQMPANAKFLAHWRSFEIFEFCAKKNRAKTPCLGRPTRETKFKSQNWKKCSVLTFSSIARATWESKVKSQNWKSCSILIFQFWPSTKSQNWTPILTFFDGQNWKVKIEMSYHKRQLKQLSHFWILKSFTKQVYGMI